MIRKRKSSKPKLDKTIYVRVSRESYLNFERASKSAGIKKCRLMDMILKDHGLRHYYEKALA